jgi:hypothetical protein
VWRWVSFSARDRVNWHLRTKIVFFLIHTKIPILGGLKQKEIIPIFSFHTFGPLGTKNWKISTWINLLKRIDW